MSIPRSAAVAICIGLLAGLPACSMFGGGSSGTRTSSTAAPATATRPELSADMVKRVQTALQQQGDYKGKIDGVWGAETQAAVQQYQSSHNLTANGQLDAATLKSLNIASTTPADQGTAAANPNAPSPGQSNPPAVSGPTYSPPGTTTQ